MLVFRFLDGQAVLNVRAVTRETTTAAVVDAELYDKQLSEVDPSDEHARVCRQVTTCFILFLSNRCH